MTAPALTHIPDILAEHLDELAFLWGQREGALRSSAYTMRELGLLEERVEARLAGVLSYGARARPLLAESLAGDDPALAFAAAFALLRGGEPADAELVLAAFAGAEGERLDALRRALLAAPAAHLLPALQARLAGGATLVAAAAAEVLAAQGGLPPLPGQLEWFVRDDAPAVRATAWRIVSQLGLPVEPKTLAAGVRDEDAAVRRAALDAAAWSGNPGLLALGRHLAAAPAPESLDALHLLAVLAGPDDLPHVAAVAGAAALGPARFPVVAAYGHPALMDVVLAHLADPDPAVAAAAGAAFERMTGERVEGETRAAPPAGEDPFEAEFRDDVALPDAERAHRHWAAVREAQGGAARLCRGHDVGRPLPPELFAVLDLETRWELFLRARYHGTWQGSPRALETYPQAGAPQAGS